MRKACFLDRDGVLIFDKDYLSDPAEVELIPGAADAIRLLHERGYLVIVVSNQSGIARGYFTPDDLKNVERRIDELLAERQVKLDGIYYCFHHPKGTVAEYTCDCDCRKPRPGMLRQAQKDRDIDLAASFIIGDKVDDLKAGFNAGCGAAALVRTGHGMEQDLAPYAGRKNVIDAPEIFSAVQA